MPPNGVETLPIHHPHLCEQANLQRLRKHTASSAVPAWVTNERKRTPEDNADLASVRHRVSPSHTKGRKLRGRKSRERERGRDRCGHTSAVGVLAVEPKWKTAKRCSEALFNRPKPKRSIKKVCSQPATRQIPFSRLFQLPYTIMLRRPRHGTKHFKSSQHGPWTDCIPRPNECFQHTQYDHMGHCKIHFVTK